MAHPVGRLPTRESTHHSQAEAFSSRLSRAPTLSPTEETFPIDEEHEHSKTENNIKSSFRRRFASARPQATKDVDSKGPLGLRSLFYATDTLIDLIFVHGLGGDSIKTWCLDNNVDLFWPQRWLPKESEFRNASIYSFGFDNDRSNTKSSTLNVHDFGDLLYDELLNSPQLRHRSKRIPIVLIGHSVGGLVAKKAYVRASQDRVHPELAERIKCIFFLATPHRGSDYTALLNGILRCSASSKDYTKDPTCGPASQLINADFARLIDKVSIYSFCETLPTTSGSSNLIVDKTSATLGLSTINEHISYLQANHRDICRFRSMNDPNYVTFKNALATAVKDLLTDVTTVNEQGSEEQLRTIREFLGISSLPEEHHEKLEGSCQWLEERQDFQSWINPKITKDMSSCQKLSIYWVQAPPGAGKSVLATHIITQLAQSRLSHASYFFHFGEKTAQSLSEFLKSMAFQMANVSASIQEKLSSLAQSGTLFDQDNARAVWTKIFVGGIFAVPSLTPQYWVIDAIDECIKYSELFTLLKGAQIRFPFRICMTSRRLPDTPRIIRQLENSAVTVVHIPEHNTMRDIALYVRSRIADVAIDEDNEREELARQILAKSDTSFLWVRLVMDELQGLYGYESIMQVLQGIPEGMFSYYERAIADLEENKRERHVAMAILRWVMLATRPLTIPELSQALQLDIKVHLSSAKSAIEGLCGHFVSVDQSSGLVQPIHATAREFLLSEEAGEFRIARAKGHESIALTCLRLLVSPAMQPPRHRRLLDQKRVKPPKTELLDYAITQFSEHVFSASSESDQLLVALDRFLITNILTWIEHVSLRKETQRLIRTAKNFKAYLDRRAKYHSPLNRHVNNIEVWATDLTRIASNFGRALNSTPSSVFFLIPPLCPTHSAVYRQFGHPSDGLAILGYHLPDWDDCIAHVQFEEKTAAAVSCGGGVIAIGTDSGKVEMYNHRSFQKDTNIQHGFSVDLIWFDPSGSFVATCSRKLVALWDLDGTLRWKARIKSRCIILTSSATALIGVTQQGRSFQWDIDTGQLLEEQSYTFRLPDLELDPQEISANKAPSAAALSPDMELLALVYRNSPVCIFEFSSGCLIGWAIDDNSRAAEQVIFNPNPDVNLLLVAYNESHLALYDPWSGALVDSLEAEKPAILTSITCSADGRTFAAMDILGHLRIWDFESLALLYHVLTPNHSFSLLSFTADGLGLVSVFEHEMRVWAPSALVRKTIEEEASTSDQAIVLPVTEGQFERFHTARIRTLVAHPHLPAFFAGNHSGEVVIYRSQDGYRPSILYSHDGVVVKCVATSNADLVASADMHAKVQVWRLSPVLDSVGTEKLIFQAQFSAPICQLLFDTSGQHLLVSTTESDHVYNTEDGALRGILRFDNGKRTSWRWFTAPNSIYSANFLLLTDRTLLHYLVEKFPAPANIAPLSLTYLAQDASTQIDITSVSYLGDSSSIAVEVRQQQLSKPQGSTYLFTLPPALPNEPGPSLSPVATIPHSLSTHSIGFSPSNKRFTFMNHDSWICSSGTHDLAEQSYTQHFFVPEEYVSESDNVPPVQTLDGDFAFCLHDKVVVVRNGLKFSTSRIVT